MEATSGRSTVCHSPLCRGAAAPPRRDSCSSGRLSAAHVPAGLTGHSSGAPTAGRQALRAAGHIIRSSGLASHRWCPLSSNVRPAWRSLCTSSSRLAQVGSPQELALPHESRLECKQSTPVYLAVGFFARHRLQRFAGGSLPCCKSSHWPRLRGAGKSRACRGCPARRARCRLPAGLTPRSS